MVETTSNSDLTVPLRNDSVDFSFSNQDNFHGSFKIVNKCVYILTNFLDQITETDTHIIRHKITKDSKSHIFYNHISDILTPGVKDVCKGKTFASNIKALGLVVSDTKMF